MENASKALIMAGGMLIGIVIISIGVYLFAYFYGTSKEIQEQVDSRVLAEFNNNFIKYQGSNNCTIHDIVSLANFAKKNNQDFEFTKNDIMNPYYVEVYLNDSDIPINKRELTFFDDYTELIKNNSKVFKSINSKTKVEETHIKYYTCTIKYNEEEGYNRVKKVEFKVTPGQQEVIN